MKKQRILIVVLVPVLLMLVLVVGLTHAQEPAVREVASVQASAVGTAFTYQGQLKVGGNPVNDTCQMAFRLYDHVSIGNQVGSPITIGVPIADGLFTVDLDFGSVFTGAARWLEIAVQCPGDPGFTTLTPRQALTPVPYALALPGLWTQQNVTSPNLIGGYGLNTVAGGVVGATISGGGSDGHLNQIYGDYGTLSGGVGNLVDSPWATVGGGISNTITVNAHQATIGGGYGNIADGYNTTIGGGQENTASSLNATVAGGYSNTAGGGAAAIGGGANNSAAGLNATVAGGVWNSAGGDHSAVGGGIGNVASGLDATIGGGNVNSVPTNYSTVGGGTGNAVDSPWATVGGGISNTITVNAHQATIGGGYGNIADGGNTTIGGGQENTASSLNATVAGGYSNTAGGNGAAVGGGANNSAAGLKATVPGGDWNSAGGDYSFAAGRNAQANNQGCFVWGDSSTASVACNNDNRWVAQAGGGVYFYTSSNLSTGMYLAAGSESWTAVSASDRYLKENFAPVDNQEVLARLTEVPITTWNYRAGDPTARHMGPMAQDFYAAFGLGEDDTHLSALDTNGVALVAIQGLYEQNQELQAENAALQEQIKALQQNAADTEVRLAALEEGSTAPSQIGFLPWGGVLLAGVGLAGVVKRERIADLVRGEGR